MASVFLCLGNPSQVRFCKPPKICLNFICRGAPKLSLVQAAVNTQSVQVLFQPTPPIQTFDWVAVNRTLNDITEFDFTGSYDLILFARMSFYWLE